MDVEQYDVRAGALDDLDRLVDVTGLADHLDVATELRPDARPEHGVVVDQHDR
jgi:hypothetical protein